MRSRGPKLRSSKGKSSDRKDEWEDESTDSSESEEELFFTPTDSLKQYAPAKRVTRANLRAAEDQAVRPPNDTSSKDSQKETTEVSLEVAQDPDERSGETSGQSPREEEILHTDSLEDADFLYGIPHIPRRNEDADLIYRLKDTQPTQADEVDDSLLNTEEPTQTD